MKIIICFFLIFSTFIIAQHSRSYEKIILVPLSIEKGKDTKYIKFTASTILHSNGEGYVYDENEIEHIITNNSIELNRERIIIDPAYPVEIKYKLISKCDLDITYSSGFLQLLRLDNTPILNIANKYYAFIKIKFEATKIFCKELQYVIDINDTTEVLLFKRFIEFSKINSGIVQENIYKYKNEFDDFYFDIEDYQD